MNKQNILYLLIGILLTIIVFLSLAATGVDLQKGKYQLGAGYSDSTWIINSETGEAKFINKNGKVLSSIKFE